MIPVGEDHRAAAAEVRDGLAGAGFRVDVDERDETVGKRIRDAELEKIPKVIVYGDRESPENLSVRDRGGEQYQVGLADFVRESPNQRPSSSPANRFCGSVMLRLRRSGR